MPAAITVSPRMITAGHLTGGFTISKYVLDGEGGLVDWTTGQPARNEQRVASREVSDLRHIKKRGHAHARVASTFSARDSTPDRVVKSSRPCARGFYVASHL